MPKPERIVIVDNGSRHLVLLMKLCRAYGGTRVVHPDDVSSIDDSNLVILSGSHAHYVAGSRHYYAEERRLVSSHRGALIGICAGMELIASVYGGTLGKLSGHQYGSRWVLLEDAALRFAMGGVPSMRVAERHGWSVTKVRRPLKVLARSDSGIEMIRHESRPIFGLQFHPELSPGDGRRMFEWALLQAGVVVPLSL